MDKRNIARTICGLVLMAAGVFVAMSIVTYDPGEGPFPFRFHPFPQSGDIVPLWPSEIKLVVPPAVRHQIALSGSCLVGALFDVGQERALVLPFPSPEEASPDLKAAIRRVTHFD